MRPGSSNNAGLGLRKGAWTPQEDVLLKNHIEKYGEGKWHLIPLKAGLNRCRKSCRLRWLNYLRPDIKRGDFEEDEVDLILRLHKLLGNRWSLIAGRIPGRTANDVKNYWNTHLQSRCKQKKELKDDGFLQETRVATIKPKPLKFKTVNSHNLAREGGSLIKSSNDGAKNKNMSPNVQDNINEHLDEIENEVGMPFGFSVGREVLNVVEQEDDHNSMFDFRIDDIDFMWSIIDSSEQ